MDVECIPTSAFITVYLDKDVSKGAWQHGPRFPAINKRHSHIKARFRHHPRPPVALPLLHSDYLTINSNPTQGNRLTAPPRLRSGAAARLPAAAAHCTVTNG